eukprot:TRINITY_DN15905_c1_g1_i2.p1 TRINITY_DN15905_c1_g1~~TRINITY_DN15905_c1_g1_i2.p1  ORF type:complete len:280 (-),score=52.84 TRINITY_DN15905_c1_g1_i2:406-1245(-)
MMVESALNHPFLESRCRTLLFGCENKSSGRAKHSHGTVEKGKCDRFFLDRRGALRSFDAKRLSRKKGGALRGRGWKYGSGFVDGVFPVLSPRAQEILKFLQKECDVSKTWASLDTLTPTHSSWDDLIDVAIQLRCSKHWDSVVSVCEWLLYKSSFKPDIICYNLLIDAFGQKSQHKKAESIYLKLLEDRCVPTDDTYALLISAYSMSGLLHKAEAVFAEMRRSGVPPSVVVYNSYIDGLMKGRNTQKAVETFQKMKKDQCQPTTTTYTMMINLYGKVSL